MLDLGPEFLKMIEERIPRPMGRWIAIGLMWLMIAALAIVCLAAIYRAALFVKHHLLNRATSGIALQPASDGPASGAPSTAPPPAPPFTLPKPHTSELASPSVACAPGANCSRGQSGGTSIGTQNNNGAK